jgi:carbonic anhydrase/acetyltransferase-like protein (isoleucine patch superfamily)
MTIGIRNFQRFDVQENANIFGDANIYGTANLHNTLSVSGAANVGSSLEVMGYTNLKDILNVFANANISGDLSVSGNANVDSSLDVQNNANILGVLDVVGAANVGSSLSVAGDVTLVKDLYVEGDRMNVKDGFIIDPHPHGERNGSGELGTLTILGNLQVEGNYNTLNTTVTESNLEVVDKTITVGRGIADDSSAEIIDAGILIGGTTLSSDKVTEIASLRYKYDNNAVNHKKYFESSIPIRMPVGWEAEEDDELISKQSITTGGQVKFDALAGIKFKSVDNQNDANSKLNEDDINLEDSIDGNMIWIYYTGTGTLNFNKLEDGAYINRQDSETNDMKIHSGMNLYIYVPNTGWIAQV